MQKDNLYKTIRKTEKESQLLWEKPQIGKKGEIPEYQKKIRDLFDFHYWVVEVIWLKDCDGPVNDDGMFTEINGKVYWIRFYPRNEFINRWKYNEEKMFKTIKKINPIENDLTEIIKKKILSYRNSWNKELNYVTGREGYNIYREITVAVMKDRPTTNFCSNTRKRVLEPPLWGLAIYKPNDKVEIWKYRKENVEVKIDDGWEIPPFAVCVDKNHRINFTKKLGQAWAIKDYERKYGAIENERM